MEIAVELSRILISEFGEQQVIFLREKNGDRNFPIMIGIAEALAIDRRLKGRPTPRPMTHDLLATIIAAMGGKLLKIVINDIVDHTFIATLHIRHGSEILKIDSRPSDAIALGAAFETPIFVAEHVIDSVLNDQPSMEDKIELLRRRMAMLREAIVEISQRLGDDDFLNTATEDVIEEHRRQLGEMKQELEAIERVLKKVE
jgi:bifunctional DNase/RNase